MAPTKIRLTPYETKSEPGTPIYATSAVLEEAPDEWFTPVTHQEKLAIMTIEHIPRFLDLSDRDHTTTSTNDCFSPRLMPLLDRMKFHFSRAIALARCEAENGTYEWQGAKAAKSPTKLPISPMDVMSAFHVEVFLAGIEEIRTGGENDKVIFRRYWRILAPPQGLTHELGGVVGASSMLEHHLRKGVGRNMRDHWNDTPKTLLAEFVVRGDGLSVGGRYLQNDD